MCVMRMLCRGGGRAGLYLALLMKRAARIVRVVERKRCDTFGGDVVFSARSRARHGACPRTIRGGRMGETGTARFVSKMPSR
jgi:hypothetical protein